jgi:hypothetical protein
MMSAEVAIPVASSLYAYKPQQVHKPVPEMSLLA